MAGVQVAKASHPNGAGSGDLGLRSESYPDIA